MIPHDNVLDDFRKISLEINIAQSSSMPRMAGSSIENDSGGSPQIGTSSNHALYSIWSSENRHWPRLHNPLARILHQPNIDSSQCSTPPVLQRQALFHCLTTPAPDIHGRPPPHHAAEDTNTMQLWQADSRRFAPWQYQDKYLVAKLNGSRTLAPDRMREQMMGFSGHHTSNTTHDPTEYHRNKSLGNTWHVPTATWLLFLMYSPTDTTFGIPRSDTVSTPTCHATLVIYATTLWTTTTQRS